VFALPLRAVTLGWKEAAARCAARGEQLPAAGRAMDPVASMSGTSGGSVDGDGSRGEGAPPAA